VSYVFFVPLNQPINYVEIGEASGMNYSLESITTSEGSAKDREQSEQLQQVCATLDGHVNETHGGGESAHASFPCSFCSHETYMRATKNHA
jgi:hypothetical protein